MVEQRSQNDNSYGYNKLEVMWRFVKLQPGLFVTLQFVNSYRYNLGLKIHGNNKIVLEYITYQKQIKNISDAFVQA